MEFSSKKNCRRDGMMHSKCFETQKVKEISRKEVGDLLDENNRKCLPHGKKEMKRLGKIANVKKIRAMKLVEPRAIVFGSQETSEMSKRLKVTGAGKTFSGAKNIYIVIIEKNKHK